MKEFRLIPWIYMFVILFFGSCSIVGGIFKAGWNLGILFAVIAIVVLALLIIRLRKK